MSHRKSLQNHVIRRRSNPLSPHSEVSFLELVHSEVNLSCQEAVSDDEGVFDRFALDLRVRNTTKSTTTGKNTTVTAPKTSISPVVAHVALDKVSCS